MNPASLKSALNDAIHATTSNISEFCTDKCRNPFSRKRKLPADHTISYLISQGASSTRNELMDFFNFSPCKPSLSALNQQRAKLKPEALENVFDRFNQAVTPDLSYDCYRFLAADGSSLTFDSFERFCPEEYYVSQGHSASGFHSMHLNAFYDLTENIYSDAFIQSVHGKDEFAAFCTIVDRHQIFDGIKNVYIGDRGYCSYNNMAHVTEASQFFLFRSKDISSKGLVKNFEFPSGEDTFDITVSVSLIRSHSRKVRTTHAQKRFVDQNTAFDYIEYGSFDSYDMTFRIVRFPISENTYECIVTNLAREEFPLEKIKEVYGLRWGIETSFRKLKYTIGLSNFHSYKPEFIKQEIWAKLIAFNATQLIINKIEPDYGEETKHAYKINFSSAAHICRIFLRLTTEKDSMDVITLLKKELIPIRDNRQYERLKTAHFRRPRHAVYRAA